jgi:hypothetical protein
MQAILSAMLLVPLALGYTGPSADVTPSGTCLSEYPSGRAVVLQYPLPDCTDPAL